MSETVFLIVLVVLAIATLTQGTKVVQENQRMVVFRFGKLMSVRGPGLHVLLPFYDKGVVVDLNADVPGWMSMSAEDLDRKVRERVLSQAIK